MLKLKDKIAVITGGNSDVGIATARELRAHGARVAIIDRTPLTASSAARDIAGDTLAVAADISNVADIDRAFQVVRESLGRIDVLFVNAGIGKFAMLADSSEALFDEITNTNYKGAYFTVQRALPLLTEGASIIFRSTAAVYFGVPGASIFASGKAALNSLAKTLALELATKKIRVNVVTSGPLSMPIMSRIGMPKERLKLGTAGFAADVPLGRFGEAEEIANAVTYLSSAENAGFTGIELILDGGLSQS